VKRLEHDWHTEPLPDNVVLGEESWLWSSFAFRHCKSRRPAAVTIGRNTGIYQGTFFDLGPAGEVSIGDTCTIVSAFFCTNRRIRIEDFVFLAHEVVLADTPFDVPSAGEPGNGAESDGGAEEASIVLGPLCWIGARATLLGGARIGEGAIIGAGAVVDFEVPPYTVVAGNPASVVRSLGVG